MVGPTTVGLTVFAKKRKVYLKITKERMRPFGAGALREWGINA
jgi:hypothetical protein